MKLYEYLNEEKLDEFIADGYISKRSHKEYPLDILNYTPKATYDFHPDEWPDHLIKSRGLIVDQLTGDIVALCQPKFWNYDPEKHKDEGEFLTFDKMDGSLGIVYRYGGLIHVATRGSFHSEQAEWATEFLREPENINYVLYLEGMIDAQFTPHVEIIYKDNRIVLDYDYEDLVLLGYQHYMRWFPPHAIDYNAYPGRVTEEFYAEELSDLPTERDNAEGFIIFYPKTGNKYKIKHSHYIDLHRVIFNLTPRRVWEKIVDGTIDEFIIGLPNELQPEVEDMAQQIRDEYMKLAIKIGEQYNNIAPGIQTKKDFALAIKDYDTKSFLFMMWDRQPTEKVRKAIYDKVKP